MADLYYFNASEVNIKRVKNMTSDLKQVNSVEELWDLEQRGALLGLIRVPNEAYHAGPGVSSTDLKKLLESPAHYKAHKKNPP
ncbi:MAG: hypothetical protein VKL39_13730, partial [Leptolyngbyaceae bacterium]|nr:hypothetical protein [Leptolyngbyaceae bacterium]